MKTVAIDIDNVLANSAVSFVAQSNDLFGDRITINDYSEDWSKMWGVSHEEAERRGSILRQHQIQKDYLPIEGANQAIAELAKKYRIVLVTSRRKLAEQLTKDWLAKYFETDFQEIVFADFWDDIKVAPDGHLLHKGELYTAVKADFVIDDQLKHCEAAIEQGLKAILFGNYPWNQEVASDTIVRCDNWNQVREYLGA